MMARTFRVGDCVRIPDGRIGRVREVSGGKYRVRVRRATSATHQFLTFAASRSQFTALAKSLGIVYPVRSNSPSHRAEDVHL